MRRRQFLGLLGGAAASPLAASAQQAKVPTIGFLGTSTAAAFSDRTAAFVSRLGQLGWNDGKSVVIEYRWADGKAENFARIADEFVRDKVDLIVTAGAAGPAVKRATSSIPVVLTVANDPVGSGLVANLSRPAATSLGFRCKPRTLSASGSSSCVNCCLRSVVWRGWSISSLAPRSSR
jgi:putative tryptophan/tyrosine transport system substrate-binding protein